MKAAVVAFIALASSVAAGGARAAELGIYAGISYAMARNDAPRSEFQNEARAIDAFVGFEPQTTTASFDSEDSAYGFMVGWRMSEHFALEGGYVDLGEVSYREHSTGVFVNPDPPEVGTLQHNIDSSTSGIQLSVLGILPLSYRWELYARGGVLIANSVESIFIIDDLGNPGRSRPTKSGFDMLAGAGISFSLAEIYSVRLEYQRVFDAGEDETLGEADVDMAALNITVSF